jgi:hypothetical protein
MMRGLALLVIVANLGYYAWSQGAFAIFGMQPAHFSEREPQRLRQQVRPQALEIRKAESEKP